MVIIYRNPAIKSTKRHKCWAIPAHVRYGIHGLSATASDYSRISAIRSRVSIHESAHDKFVRSDGWWFGVYRCHSGRCAVWIVFQEMAHLLLRKRSLVILFVYSMTKLIGTGLGPGRANPPIHHLQSCCSVCEPSRQGAQDLSCSQT